MSQRGGEKCSVSGSLLQVESKGCPDDFLHYL